MLDQTWFHPAPDPIIRNETKRIADQYIVIGSPTPLPIPQYVDAVLPRLPEMALSNMQLAELASPSNERRQYAHGSGGIDLMPLRDVPSWPLTDPAQQHLFTNYVLHLATWLDLCDPDEAFQKDVPKRAETSHILLNAIFALSARHLNLTTKTYDQLESNRYHSECLSQYRLMTGDAGTFQNASLFAALIILRVLEEIEMPVMGSQVHLTGLKHFVDARDHSQPVESEARLSEACFWVGLRQEIYSAVSNHKPIQMSLSNRVVDRSTAVALDHTWANRAVVLCADVINCCFTNFEVDQITWSKLMNYASQWWESRPVSCRPTRNLPARPTEGMAFTELKFTHGSHVIGEQHYLLGRILLAMFNPSVPRFGPGRKAAKGQMEKEIISYLRDLCGIGVHNSDTPPAMFTASMGISICGDLFEDRADQEALLYVLDRTERDHARPTAAIQDSLKKDWGWTV